MPVGLYCHNAREPNWADVDHSAGEVAVGTNGVGGVNNNPCQSFYGTAVPTAALRLQAVSGNNQIVTVGQIFQPVVTRVTDSDAPPHPRARGQRDLSVDHLAYSPRSAAGFSRGDHHYAEPHARNRLFAPDGSAVRC